MKLSYILAVFILVVSCAAQKMPAPSQAHVDRVAKRFPTASLAELNKGKMLYEQHCGKCHKFVKPETLPEMEWLKIVPVMAQKAKIDQVAQDYILKYTIALSKPAESNQ